MFKKSLIGVLAVAMLAGCAKYQMVPYEEVQETNYVRVKLQNGHKVEGSVTRTEPHQLTLRKADAGAAYLPKAEIVAINRKPPVYDDFKKGISEEEIAQIQTNKNTLIYGIGGGAISLGTSFFIGSMASKNMDENGGAVLYGTTAVGGGLGTYFFIRAGQEKDRKVAIEAIRHQRVSAEYKRRGMEEPQTDASKQRELEAEKKRQQDLRKERERLLKELEEKNK